MAKWRETIEIWAINIEFEFAISVKSFYIVNHKSNYAEFLEGQCFLVYQMTGGCGRHHVVLGGSEPEDQN